MLIATAAAQEHITVFTVTARPVTLGQYRQAQLYYLDEPDRLLAELGTDLTTDLDAATDKVAQRMASEKGQRQLDAIEIGFRGLYAAWVFDIVKLPAIVIDEHYVVYGIDHVDQALELVRRATQ